MNKVNTILYIVFHIFINYYEFTCCIENSVDPDQLASEVYKRVDIWFYTVFERVNCLSTERYKLIYSFGQVNFSLDTYIMAFYLSLDKQIILIFPHPCLNLPQLILTKYCLLCVVCLSF